MWDKWYGTGSLYLVGDPVYVVSYEAISTTWVLDDDSIPERVLYSSRTTMCSYNLPFQNSETSNMAALPLIL